MTHQCYSIIGNSMGEMTAYCRRLEQAWTTG